MNINNKWQSLLEDYNWNSQKENIYLNVKKDNFKAENVNLLGRIWMKIKSMLGCGTFKKTIQFVIKNESEFKNLVNDDKCRINFSTFRTKIKHYGENHYFARKVSEKALLILTKTQMPVTATTNPIISTPQTTTTTTTTTSPVTHQTITTTTTSPVTHQTITTTVETKPKPTLQVPLILLLKPIVGNKKTTNIKEALFTAVRFAFTSETDIEKLMDNSKALKKFNHENPKKMGELLNNHFLEKEKTHKKTEFIQSKWINNSHLNEKWLFKFWHDENVHSAFVYINNIPIGLRKRREQGVKFVEIFNPSESTISYAYQAEKLIQKLDFYKKPQSTSNAENFIYYYQKL